MKDGILIIYGILITGLIILVFIQQRTIQAVNIKLMSLITPPTPPADGDGKTETQKTGSGDWMQELQNKIKKVDVEFTT